MNILSFSECTKLMSALGSLQRLPCSLGPLGCRKGREGEKRKENEGEEGEREADSGVVVWGPCNVGCSSRADYRYQRTPTKYSFQDSLTYA